MNFSSNNSAATVIGGAIVADAIATRRERRGNPGAAGTEGSIAFTAFLFFAIFGVLAYAIHFMKVFFGFGVFKGKPFASRLNYALNPMYMTLIACLFSGWATALAFFHHSWGSIIPLFLAIGACAWSWEWTGEWLEKNDIERTVGGLSAAVVFGLFIFIVAPIMAIQAQASGYYEDPRKAKKQEVKVEEIVEVAPIKQVEEIKPEQLIKEEVVEAPPAKEEVKEEPKAVEPAASEAQS